MKKSIKYITGITDEVMSHYVINTHTSYANIKKQIHALYPIMSASPNTLFVFLNKGFEYTNPKEMAQCLGEVPFNCLLLPEWLPYTIDYNKHNICEGCKGYFKKEEINDNGYCESCQYTYEQILDHRTGC